MIIIVFSAASNNSKLRYLNLKVVQTMIPEFQFVRFSSFNVGTCTSAEETQSCGFAVYTAASYSVTLGSNFVPEPNHLEVPRDLPGKCHDITSSGAAIDLYHMISNSPLALAVLLVAVITELQTRC